MIVRMLWRRLLSIEECMVFNNLYSFSDVLSHLQCLIIVLYSFCNYNFYLRAF